ncbi:hypothetical protein J6590_025744 [Homalodisca vitripennis]|nr:hypothetical protein J6590_025744 [Homalodisca vitripennis]
MLLSRLSRCVRGASGTTYQQHTDIDLTDTTHNVFVIRLYRCMVPNAVDYRASPAVSVVHGSQCCRLSCLSRCVRGASGTTYQQHTDIDLTDTTHNVFVIRLYRCMVLNAVDYRASPAVSVVHGSQCCRLSCLSRCVRGASGTTYQQHTVIDSTDTTHNVFVIRLYRCMVLNAVDYRASPAVSMVHVSQCCRLSCLSRCVRGASDTTYQQHTVIDRTDTTRNVSLFGCVAVHGSQCCRLSRLSCCVRVERQILPTNNTVIDSTDITSCNVFSLFGCTDYRASPGCVRGASDTTYQQHTVIDSTDTTYNVFVIRLYRVHGSNAVDYHASPAAVSRDLTDTTCNVYSAVQVHGLNAVDYRASPAVSVVHGSQCFRLSCLSRCVRGASGTTYQQHTVIDSTDTTRNVFVIRLYRCMVPNAVDYRASPAVSVVHGSQCCRLSRLSRCVRGASGTTYQQHTDIDLTDTTHNVFVIRLYRCMVPNAVDYCASPAVSVVHGSQCCRLSRLSRCVHGASGTTYQQHTVIDSTDTTRNVCVIQLYRHGSTAVDYCASCRVRGASDTTYQQHMCCDSTDTTRNVFKVIRLQVYGSQCCRLSCLSPAVSVVKLHASQCCRLLRLSRCVRGASGTTYQQHTVIDLTDTTHNVFVIRLYRCMVPNAVDYRASPAVSMVHGSQCCRLLRLSRCVRGASDTTYQQHTVIDSTDTTRNVFVIRLYRCMVLNAVDYRASPAVSVVHGSQCCRLSRLSRCVHGASGTTYQQHTVIDLTDTTCNVFVIRLYRCMVPNAVDYRASPAVSVVRQALPTNNTQL